MAVTTPESFLEVLEKSKLLSQVQVAKARQAAGQAKDARTLAKTLIRQELLTPWQASQVLAGRSFFLGKYKLIDLLGRGGMGSVFYAEHTTMNRPVALKIISKQLGRDPTSVERFLTEARAIAALDHPNIVHAYNVDSHGDRYFLVMEFVRGQDLQRMVDADGPLEFQPAADYIRQAAEGLAHAHGRKMIHCDIKPANLIVNKQNVLKILDMGMARLIARGTDEANGQDERVLGTVDYQAPEQAVESPQLDHRVDIYALGCTFYFLLTGHPPFSKGTLAERIVKHQTQEPPSILAERSGVPKDLVAICRKMMAKNPADRFQSADKLVEVLAAWEPPEQKLKRAVPLTEDEKKQESPSKASDSFSIKVDTGTSRATGGTASRTRSRKKKGAAAGTNRLAALFADRRKTIIAAAVGGLVLLGLLVVLIFFLVGGGDEKPDKDAVAQKTPSQSQSDQKQKSSPKDDEFPTPQMVDDDWQAIEAAVGGSEKPSPPSKKPKPAQSAPPAPEKPAPEKPSAATQPKQSPAAQPKQTVEPKPPATEKPKPKPKESPADKPKPAAEKPKPETKQPPAEKPKPAAKPKTPPAKKPAPKPDPLKNLKAFVALPELKDNDPPGQESKAPFPLGEIRSAAADADWQLLLLGGEDALKGDRKFLLQQNQTEAAKASWLVQLDAIAPNKERAQTDVARIRRDKNSLVFQWAEEAQTASANYLRNCILQVRVEGKSKHVTLTEPSPAEPILMDLTRGSGGGTATVKYAPEIEKIRIQITKVEGRKGHTVSPEEPAAPKVPIALRFAREDRYGNQPDGVEFRVLASVRRPGVVVDLRLMQPDSRAFKSYESLRLTDQRLGTMRDQLALKQNSAKRTLATAKGDEKSKLSKEIDFYDRELWYFDFYREVHKKAKLHYRVFMDVDGQQVVLATTEPAT